MTDVTRGDAVKRPAHADSQAAEADPELPAEVVEEIDARVEAKLERVELEQYNSPFPHPDHLERFEALYPGAARVVFESFDEQGKHRREMEKRFVKGNEVRAFIGQWLAFVLVLAALSLGLVCILNGQAVVGGTIVTVAFGGGVVLYIAGAGSRGRGPARRTGPTKRDKASATRETAVVRPPASE
ncbi:DUF2335 domain-containing protein [Agromyces kandeliae]|uniref:DUF2335 domain-containing protein n=1 Tax=Agromyces kandeliae TaxID=2666141 RepID=A0A6L5R617_9MICO|nr:DUF2335 domain-containing protein [Agromyces kandeliae]MRX45330.1 DUF2335 domain-containing protein [Agromyces kandeliae]